MLVMMQRWQDVGNDAKKHSRHLKLPFRVRCWTRRKDRPVHEPGGQPASFERLLLKERELAVEPKNNHDSDSALTL